MACNKPLYRLPTIVEALPPQFQHRIKNGALVCNQHDRDYLIKVHGKKEDWFQQIPCGQCTACRLEYSRQWAIRCVLEASYHKYNWFITLTYDDYHLPKGRLLDLDTGEIEQNDKGELRAVLCEKDMQDFLKRLRISATRKGLREEDLSDIRYFYAGEYGETYKRPHYHMLTFGLNVPDLVFDFVKDGYTYYQSAWLSQVWGKGIVCIGEFNFDTAAYTSRYVLKKQKGLGAKEMREKKRTVIMPDNLDLLFEKTACKLELQEFRDEFCRMSRRPGIGKRYFEEHKDSIYETDSLYVKTAKGLMEVKPPSYYDNLFDIDNHDQLEVIKQNRRKVAKARNILKMAQTSLSEVEYREQLEEKKKIQIKKLKRVIE